MHLTLSASGPAEPAEVWERYVRPSLWSGWSPQVRRVQTDAATGDRLRAGSTGTVLGPPGIGVRFVVEDLDEQARTWHWRVRPATLSVPLPVSLRLGHGVVGSPAGTSTWLTLTGPPALVLAYAPVARWALHRLVHAGPVAPTA